MAMNVGSPQGGISGEINITPLIDVVLVLLIIFMVLVPQTLKQLSARIPEKQEAVTQADVPPQIILAIGPGGELSLGNDRVELGALPGVIRQRLEQVGGQVVFFDVDDRARYGAVVKIMDVVKGAGARTLGLVTRE